MTGPGIHPPDLSGRDQSESANSSGKGFSIELVPIADESDKMEFLSNLALIGENTDFDIITQLGISGHNQSTGVFPDSGLDTLFSNLQKAGIRVGRSSYITYDKLRNSGVLMFKVQDVAEFGGYIIITTTDGELFYGKFDEYLDKGACALKKTSEHIIQQMKVKTSREETYTHEKGILRIRVANKFHSISADSYCIADAENHRVTILSNNNLRYINYDNDGYDTEAQIYDLSDYGDVKQLSTDPNNNFYFIITEKEGVNSLRILNRSTLEEVQAPYEGIKEIVYMSHEQGKLFCTDDQGYLRVIIIGTSSLERGYVDKNSLTLQDNSSRVVKIQDTIALKLKQALDAGSISLSEDLDVSSGDGESVHADIVELIWDMQVGGTTFKEKFESATTVDEMDVVQSLFLQIQGNSLVKSVDGITAGIERKIFAKRSEIVLKSISDDLDVLDKQVTDAVAEQDIDIAFPRLIHLQGEFDTLKKLRAQVAIVDVDLDDTMTQMESTLSGAIDTIRQSHAESMKRGLDELIHKVDTYLEKISYLSGITTVYDTPAYKDAQKIIGFLEADEKSSYEDKLDALIQSHMDRISREGEKAKDTQRAETEEKVRGIRRDINKIQQVIASIDDRATLRSMKVGDPLVIGVQDSIANVPKAEADILNISLDGIFNEREQQIRIEQLYNEGVSVSLDENGIDTGLYYVEPENINIGFKLEGKRTKDGAISLSLHYDDGTVFDIDTYLKDPAKYSEGMIFDDIPSELSQKDFVTHQKNYISWIKSGKKKRDELRSQFSELRNDASREDEYKALAEQYRELLEKYKSARILEYFATHLANTLDLNPRSHYKLPNPNFIVLDEEKELLQKMSAGFSIQKREQKGIDILEGDPGLGKTVICEYIGAVTNREVIRVQCAKMDPSDLFFSPQLKAGETSREPADWIKLMQKPGTIVLFDEIDKLDPQSFERLHSLFDGARSVYDPQMGRVRAHPDCLFVGTRNSYELMSNPIVSRATIIQVTAPSQINEAFKVARYTGIDYFTNMEYEEFVDLYQNGINTNGVPNAEKIVEYLQYIQWLVGVLHALREAQKADNWNEKFEFEVSYRDAEQIFLRFTQYSDTAFKDVVKEVLTPKARAVVKDFEDKDTQAKILGNVIDRVMV